MDPKTSIPPQPAIRRNGAKKWHLRDGHSLRALCGIGWRSIFTAETGTIYNAAQVGCNNCLIEAIKRRSK